MTAWRGEAYNRQASLQETVARESLAGLSLEGSEHVLDVGCGDGKITSQIAARLPHGSIVGTDVSQDMIAFASSRFAGDEHPNVHFLVADARRLPFEREFDLVVSFNALHWVKDQTAALCSIAATLKLGGKAVLQFVPAGEHASIEDVIDEVRQSPRWSSYFAGFEAPFVHFTPTEYREIAAQSGLRLFEDHVAEHRWDFGSRKSFSDWCHATFGFWLTRLPEDQHQAFIDEVLDKYQLEATPGFRNESTFTFYQLRVVAGI